MRVACAFCLSWRGGPGRCAGMPEGRCARSEAKVLPEVGCRGEVAFLRNGLYRQVAHFEESLSELDALAHQSLIRGRSRARVRTGEAATDAGARGDGQWERLPLDTGVRVPLADNRIVADMRSLIPATMITIFGIGAELGLLHVMAPSWPRSQPRCT
jgi:hypothetical protein